MRWTLLCGHDVWFLPNWSFGIVLAFEGRYRVWGSWLQNDDLLHGTIVRIVRGLPYWEMMQLEMNFD